MTAKKGSSGSRKRAGAKDELTEELVKLAVATSVKMLKKHGPGAADKIVDAAPRAVHKVADVVGEGVSSATKNTAAAPGRAFRGLKARLVRETPARPLVPETLVPLPPSPVRILMINADAPGQDQYNLNGAIDVANSRIFRTSAMMLGMRSTVGSSTNSRTRSSHESPRQSLCQSHQWDHAIRHSGIPAGLQLD